MNKTKLIAFILIIAALITLAACGGNEKEVLSIQIIDGSAFKSTYSLGEQITLTGTKFLITYTDGSTQILEGGKDILIGGFNTDIPGEGKQMTVSYNGVSVTLYYNVVVQAGLDTDFRLSMSTSVGSDGGLDIAVVTAGVENVPEGVYGISFVVKVREAVFVSLISTLGADWTVMHTRSGDTVKVLLHSTNGNIPLEASGNIVRLSVAKNEGHKPSSVTISDIRITNGERDFIGIPSYSINL